MNELSLITMQNPIPNKQNGNKKQHKNNNITALVLGGVFMITVIIVVLWGSAYSEERKDSFYYSVYEKSAWGIERLVIPFIFAFIFKAWPKIPKIKWLKMIRNICLYSVVSAIFVTLGGLAAVVAVSVADGKVYFDKKLPEQTIMDPMLPKALAPNEHADDSPAPAPLDISDTHFYMPKSFDNEADEITYILENVQRVVLFIYYTPYREAAEYHNTYYVCASRAAENEILAKKNYPVHAYPGVMNLTSDEEKTQIREIHINWIKEMQICVSDRKRAHEYTTTYENVKELGNYYLSLGDAYIRLEEYKNAYDMYVEAIKYYVIALQLSVTSSAPTNNAVYVIRQLAELYGKFRLQDAQVIGYFINDSGSRDQLKQTVGFYLALCQHVEEFHVPAQEISAASGYAKPRISTFQKAA